MENLKLLVLPLAVLLSCGGTVGTLPEPDASQVVDEDGGQDAGSLVDAGSLPDAGKDAGMDSGPIDTDAGGLCTIGASAPNNSCYVCGGGVDTGGALYLLDYESSSCPSGEVCKGDAYQRTEPTAAEAACTPGCYYPVSLGSGFANPGDDWIDSTVTPAVEQCCVVCDQEPPDGGTALRPFYYLIDGGAVPLRGWTNRPQGSHCRTTSGVITQCG